jgi:hypothetical protein
MKKLLMTENKVIELNKIFGLGVSKERSVQLESLTPEDRQCPLCPGHKDEDFEWNNLLNAPVCLGCSYDIHNGFVGFGERPTSEQYNHADTIERIEQLTGQSFQQLKFQHLINKIEEFTGKKPEFVNGITFQDIPDSELRILNKQLDDEMYKIYKKRCPDIY